MIIGVIMRRLFFSGLRKVACFLKPTVRISLIVGVMMLGSHSCFAANTLNTISTAIGKSVSTTAKILVDVALIAGIGFVFAAAFKLHQHKMNPTQVPMSQGISLLVIGGGLTMFPQLITIPGTAVLGNSQSVAKIGSGITFISS